MRDSSASLRERSRRFLDWLIIGPGGPIVVSRPVIPGSVTGYPSAPKRESATTLRIALTTGALPSISGPNFSTSVFIVFAGIFKEMLIA